MSRSNTITNTMIGFPGVGFPTSDGHWKVLFSGVVFQPPDAYSLRQRMLIRMLGGIMKATPEELTSPIFQQRIIPFVADGSRRCSINVSIGSSSWRLKKATRKTGQFQELLCIEKRHISPFTQTDSLGRETIDFQVSIESDPDVKAEGVVYLLQRSGTSIISDIDDTIKDSSVVNRRQLLTNTFLKEFRSVDGMAQLYREWADTGASFHYVSSSPWQLYEPLREMNRKYQFPSGTVHLKTFRVRDHLFQRMKLTRHGKSSVIRFLMKHLPDRQFVLIGDSGERDPEIYAKICQKYANRIKGVFIRDLTQKPLCTDRWQKMKASFNGQIGTFQTADELQGLTGNLF